MVLPRVRARTHREPLAYVAMEHARPLIEADHGPERIVGLGVDREDALHVGDEGPAAPRRDHPLLNAVRSETAFLSVWRTASRLTGPSSHPSSRPNVT